MNSGEDANKLEVVVDEDPRCGIPRCRLTGGVRHLPGDLCNLLKVERDR